MGHTLKELGGWDVFFSCICTEFELFRHVWWVIENLFKRCPFLLCNLIASKYVKRCKSSKFQAFNFVPEIPFHSENKCDFGVTTSQEDTTRKSPSDTPVVSASSTGEVPAASWTGTRRSYEQWRGEDGRGGRATTTTTTMVILQLWLSQLWLSSK